ncbi:MAG TPA: glycoside hydrolase family 30 protein [Candidatus Acidoferrales bacterium]|jgi:glucosylceramidase|nr:glycoside hydrolase family 30 protein [Candidatus Acidoferrales bacterium]
MKIFNRSLKPLAALLAVTGSILSANASPDTAVEVYVTAKDTGQLLAKAPDLHFEAMPQPTEKQPCIFVDSGSAFQTLLGIGGALTDASAETFYKLSKDKQQEVLRAYFDPANGIGYSLGRTHINSCDFSSESYTYVTNGDRELKSFDISHDKKYRIPFIKEAMAIAGKDFHLFISPWSPPAWMKSNQDMLHGGSLLREDYAPWASYFAKFIQAYEREGVPIWGMTVQNEPMANQTWESCVYTAQEECDFVKVLGPTLKRNGLKDKKILIWDHNRGMMYQRAKGILDDPIAAKYVWGMGFHWYVNDSFDNVKRVAETYPKIRLMLTEGCLGPFDFKQIGEWQWGETYAKSMVNDFNNGAVGWTDWNVLLDTTGGPNHLTNFCFAPIHADTGTGQLYYMNSFYYIGHFSKFIRPGARRIASSPTTDVLLTTAFLNPDGKIAVVVLNPGDKEQPFSLWNEGRAAATTSAAHSIMTLVFANPGGASIAARED